MGSSDGVSLLVPVVVSVLSELKVHKKWSSLTNRHRLRQQPTDGFAELMAHRKGLVRVIFHMTL